VCSWSSNTGTQVSGGRSEEAEQRLPPLQTEIGECDSLLVAGSFASSAKVAASGRRVQFNRNPTYLFHEVCHGICTDMADNE